MERLVKKYGSLISSRVFTLNDQYEFSQFSADINPIHIDPIYARRTIVGECIVHGVHGLMWALNNLLKTHDLYISSFEAKFLKSIPLNEPICLFWNNEKNKLSIANDGTLFTTIVVRFGAIKTKANIFDIKVEKALAFPKCMALKQCAELGKQELVYRGNIDKGKILFPELFQTYGDALIAEISSASEIIGMQIPGLNSLFLSIKGEFSVSHEISSFEIEKCDLRFGVLEISLRGKYLKACINALYRPQPQRVPHISYLKKFVSPNTFKSVNALIIGGSRGLGELTAKLIALGGGRLTITYNQGEMDAKNIRSEIERNGSSCNIEQLTIAKSFHLPLDDFNQIYYFPTPRIKPEDTAIEGENLFSLYQMYYVDGFYSLILQALERRNFIKIFYPSTNFIDKPPFNFALYAKAKLNGENLCKEFNKTGKLEIIYPRLPRMATDQTLSLMPELFEDSIQVILPLIKDMCNDFHI